MPELTEGGLRLLDYLPATYGATAEDLDPLVARWLDPLAFELDLLRALLLAIRTTAIPGSSDDSLGFLSSWEAELKLPVAPPDATDNQRAAVVRSALRGRIVASSRQWAQAVTAIVGSDNWSVSRNTPAPDHLTVSIPFGADSYTGAQIEALVRRRSPATQVIVMAFNEGFIVGESDVGAPI